MVNDFQLTISVEDFLRIVNEGMRTMTFGDLIERADKVTRIEYSRDTKRYTLRVHEWQEAQGCASGNQGDRRRNGKGARARRE